MMNPVRLSNHVMRALGVVLALAVVACAPVQERADGSPAKPLVYPGPPDPPRFYFERAIYSSADVRPNTEEERWKQMLTGVARSGELLGKPYAVAVHQGKVFVSDSVESSVRVFDFPNGKHSRLGFDDASNLGQPLGIDVDAQGRLYVADARARQVVVFDPDGKYERRIGDKDSFDRLASVTVDSKTDRVYAIDIGGVQSQNHRVRVYQASTGKHLFDIGKRGAEPGEFNLPRDVAIGKDGQIYVVDGGNFRIQVFDKDGKYLNAFGAVGRQLGNFARPKEIATDKDGNVYVVDTAFGNFQIFNPDGELLMFIGGRNEQDGPASYLLPSGIAVDEDGRVYMVDQWFRKVDVFRPASLKETEGWLGKRNEVAVTK